MNALECQMVDLLKNLRDSYQVVGIKAEFEAEGTRLEEAMRLKEITTRAGLELSIKIGGCEAIRDMYDAKSIGVRYVIAPMIETPYALKKYIQAATSCFDSSTTKLLINIETTTGFENLQKICTQREFEHIDGVVLGRVDMAGSMGLSRDDVNGQKLLDIAMSLAHTLPKYGKDMIVGGGVSSESLAFLAKLPRGALSRFETRKVIFASAALESPHIAQGLTEAVHFELLWLQNKRNFYKAIYQEDEKRIEMLEQRYQVLLQGDK